MRTAIVLFVVMLLGAGGLLFWSGNFPKSANEAALLASRVTSPEARTAALASITDTARAVVSKVQPAWAERIPTFESVSLPTFLADIGLSTTTVMSEEEIDPIRRYNNTQYLFGFLYPHLYALEEEEGSDAYVFGVRLTLLDVLRGTGTSTNEIFVRVHAKADTAQDALSWAKANPSSMYSSATGEISDAKTAGSTGIGYKWKSSRVPYGYTHVFASPEYIYEFTVHAAAFEEAVVMDYNELMRTSRAGIPSPNQ